MNHLKWMGHSATIFEIQRELRNNLKSCEVTLVGINGSVRAHRFVLSTCSELLRAALKDVPIDQETTIIVPDIRGALLDSVLAFIYMGETNITSTNLSEFLEAINTLGIRSAISFECNPTTVVSPQSTLPMKSLSSIQITHDDLFDQEQIAEKIETSDVIGEQQSSTTTRNINFLDVYNDTQQHKITYSIEHMPVASNTNDFILTENTESYTLHTQNTKLVHNDDCCDKVEESLDEDVDNDATHLIEEYSSSGEATIDDSNAANDNPPPPPPQPPVASNSPVNTYISSVITMKPKYKNCINGLPATTTTAAAATVVATKSTVTATATKVNNKVNNQLIRKTNAISMDLLTNKQIQTNAVKSNVNTNNFTTAASSSAYDENTVGIDEALGLAVQAVINEGMSLQKAAVKFDLSKTVLWRRVRKHPDYMKSTRENPLLSMACERLKRGESLKSISKDLDIPMSTLHRHKVRLAQQGRLPDYVVLKKRDSVTKDELKKKLMKAVHACIHDGMSQNQAANLFAIPKSTLWRHLQKRTAESDLVHAIDRDDIKTEVILS